MKTFWPFAILSFAGINSRCVIGSAFLIEQAKIKAESTIQYNINIDRIIPLLFCDFPYNSGFQLRLRTVFSHLYNSKVYNVERFAGWIKFDSNRSLQSSFLQPACWSISFSLIHNEIIYHAILRINANNFEANREFHFANLWCHVAKLSYKSLINVSKICGFRKINSVCGRMNTKYRNGLGWLVR